MRANIPALGVVLALAFAGPLARAEQRPMIDAKEGSVGIGGNVTLSTITIGVPAEKIEELIRSRTKDLGDLAESQRERIAQLKETLSLTRGQVSHALKVLGEANIPPEQLAAKLEEIAEKFKDLQQAAAAQPGDDAKITALKAEAQQAIQDGQLGKADKILAAIEKAQTEAIDRLALNAAQTAAQRGDVALGRLRYIDAAQHFAEAAARVPPGNKDKRVKYLDAEAGALLKQGFEFGDDTAALSAIARCRALVELLPRNASPRDWARAQNNLGFALFRVGARESGTARLEQAVAAYHEALQEFTRERVPLLWAMTQKNLGLALIELGGRESGRARLEEAVAVLQEALQEVTRARDALLRAFIQNNLGGALVRLGARESGTARLEEAVVVLQEALQEATRPRAPLLWAMTQVGLGQALQAIGERESGAARLEQAVAAYHEALKELTRERAPPLWAETQNKLGVVLTELGKRGSGTAKLEEAVAAYHEALQESTRTRAPLLWAKRTGNQGVALMLFGGRTGDAEMAKVAVEQIETAITNLRHDGDAPSAEFFETRLLLARALVDQLAKH
jgi:tetratricopeptide (TPR) repeat protein